MVKIQEAEHQIITDYEVFPLRPPDQELLIPAIEKHREIFGKVPQLVATDAGFFSSENKTQAKELSGSGGSRFPTRRAKTRPDRKSRSSVGFGERSVGGWDAKGGSVFSREGMGCGGVVTEG